MPADAETTGENLQAMKPLSFESLKRKDDTDPAGKAVASTSASGASICTQPAGTHSARVVSGNWFETPECQWRYLFC